ncbi:MAG: RecX family transcriptional regulator [Bacteroidaceae bacterium]|nr:RecX family transcriptional regulator [Bacteroidaceae bacterium]
MKPLSASEAMAKAANLCSRSEHCIADIQEKLYQWGFEGDAESIIGALQKQGFINEERYTRAYINDKYRFAKWGRIKIEQGLRQKRIPSQLYHHLMEEVIDTDEYRQILRDLLKQKRKTLKESDEYMLRTKLSRFALQRGFTYEEVLCNIDA